MSDEDGDGPAMAAISKARDIGVWAVIMAHRKAVIFLAILAGATAYWLTPNPPPPPAWIKLDAEGVYEISRKGVIFSLSYVARDECPGAALWTMLVEDVSGRIITQVSRQPARIWLGRHNMELRFRWPGDLAPRKAAVKVSCTQEVDQTAEVVVADLPEQSSPIVPIRSELMMPPLGAGASPKSSNGTPDKRP